MASLNFCELVLSDAADPSDVMAFPTVSVFTAGLDTPGEVRGYANGLTRLVTRSGRSRKARAVLPHLDRAQVAWLERHAARLLLIRSGQGHAFFGTFFSPDFQELGFIPEADTELSFTEVTGFGGAVVP